MVTKAEFAELMNVTRQRVSQWLSARQIDGEALVGEGRAAQINVEIARQQLSDRLSLSQRLGANGKALLGGGASPLDATSRRRDCASLFSPTSARMRTPISAAGDMYLPTTCGNSLAPLLRG